jgi:hypothetical protein
MKPIPTGQAKTCAKCGQTFALVVYERHEFNCAGEADSADSSTDANPPRDPLVLLEQDRHRVGALAAETSFLNAWERSFASDLQRRLSPPNAAPLSSAQRSKVGEVEASLHRNKRPVLVSGGLPGHGKKA